MSVQTPYRASIGSELSGAQAADVIRYYHDNENSIARRNGWTDKVSLGQSALRAMTSRHSILPDGTPTLTGKEVAKGLAYIENPPKSEEYERRFDDLVDNKGFTADEARRRLHGQGLT